MTTYKDAGVDIDAGAELVRRIAPLAEATRRPGSLDGLGGFGGLFDLAAAGLTDPILVAATDGVGTKLELGIAAGRLKGLGQDLVAMVLNDLVCQGAEPLFFLDYFATGTLDVDQAAEVVAGIAAACAACRTALIGGETAEMPGLYAPGTFDLAGFAVGAVERGAQLPRDVRPGDAILGLPATGPHSNGYSLIRALGPDLAAPFADGTLADALLAPTALYVAPVLAVRDRLKAAAHITGGGLPENLPRALMGHGARLGTWPRPPIFDWLAERVAPEEMLRTFNGGIGMALVAAPDQAGAIAEATGAIPIGEVTAEPGLTA